MQQQIHKRLADAVIEDIANGAEGHGFDSRDGQIGQCRQRLVTASMFLDVSPGR